MRHQMSEKSASPKKEKKCHRKGDVKQEEAKGVINLKQGRRSCKATDLFTIIQGAGKALEAHKKPIKSPKSAKKGNGKKGDEENEEGKDLKHRKHRSSTDCHQVKREKKEEAKDVRARKQKGSKASHDNTLTKAGSETSDLQKKKIKKIRQNSHQHQRVQECKSGVDERRRAKTNPDDRDVDYVTSPTDIILQKAIRTLALILTSVSLATRHISVGQKLLAP